MARLQILELPEGTDDDRPPFVLVVDQCMPQRVVLGLDTSWQDHWQELADKIGAQGVIVTPDTIDIPANEITLSDVADGNVVRIRVEPDLEGFTDTVIAEVAKAQVEAIDAARQQMIDELGEKRATPTGEEIPAVEALNYRTMGLAHSLEEAQAAIHRVHNLHRPVEHRGQTICWECSSYDFAALSTDSTPVAHDQCGTLQALNAKQPKPGPAHG